MSEFIGGGRGESQIYYLMVERALQVIFTDRYKGDRSLEGQIGCYVTVERSLF